MNDTSQSVLMERFPDVIRFRDTLTPESDRGCALIAVAYIDTSLGTLLSKCFLKDKVANDFLRSDGPLGTFSARIDAAFLLGKLSKVSRRELHLLRKIRNEFGHNPDPITFDQPSVAARCTELRYTCRESTASARQHFTSSACGCLASIHAAESATEPPSLRPDYVLNEDQKARARTLVDRVFKVLLNELPPDADEGTIANFKCRALEMLMQEITAEQVNKPDRK